MNNIDTKVPLIVGDNNFQTIALHSRWFRPSHSSFIIPRFGLVSEYVTDTCERCAVRHPLGVWNLQHHEVRTLHSGLPSVRSLQKSKNKRSSSVSKLPSSPPRPVSWKTSQRGRAAGKKSFRLVRRLNSLAFWMGLENRPDQRGTSLERWTHRSFTGVWTCHIYCAEQTGSSPRRLAVSREGSCAKCCQPIACLHSCTWHTAWTRSGSGCNHFGEESDTEGWFDPPFSGLSELSCKLEKK